MLKKAGSGRYLLRPLDHAFDIKRSIKPIENIIRNLRPVFSRGTNGRTIAQEKRERPINASPRNQKITAKRLRKVHFNKLIFNPQEGTRQFGTILEERP